MKKLILFLESIRDSSSTIEAAAIQHTINIIRTYKDDDSVWMDVSNSFPPLKAFSVFKSLNVNVSNEKGQITVGYYDYYENEWHCDNINIIPYKWTYLSHSYKGQIK